MAASPRRILLLEDEWLLAEEIETALRKWGFEIIGPVGRIEQALALIEEDVSIDAAVLDINLHGERSFRVAERLMQTSTPFVFLSGYSDAALPTEFRDRPMMTRPADVQMLCRCLDALIKGA